MSQRRCGVNLTTKHPLKFNEEHLNYCSLFSTFKGLRNVKTLKSFFFPEGYSVPSQISNKEFFEKKY